MKKNTLNLLAIAAFCFLIYPLELNAHCDAMDGPLIKDAQIAITSKNVDPILKWVKREYEKEIRELFAKTLKVRKMSDEAKEIAEMHFYETVVRIHRAGEGAPFTGIKPTGNIDPLEQKLDQMLEKGNIDELANKIGEHATKEVKNKFEAAILKKKEKDKSINAGKEFVTAYVEYMHYVLGLHEAINRASHHAVGNEHQHQ